jgi:hypothetical protein
LGKTGWEPGMETRKMNTLNLNLSPVWNYMV